ncbi:MAG: methionyl-tRNA formyltransferase [Flavobacteriales bacterium]|nr:methionyl-tRNA formyltransferase [Flavobacteriales bacterium]
MKEKKDLRIVFMGTPEFAVGQLDAIIEAGYNVVGVVTVPDRPAGRGKKLTPSAVKLYAESRNLPVLTPEKLRDEEFLTALKEWEADLFVVVAFRMLPRVVWGMPAMGTFNLHASLLPEYRGAAPINHAIINGEKKTGVTTFLLDEDIDTGLIINQKSIDITDEDDFGLMYEKLMTLGRGVTVETIELLRTGSACPTPQVTDGSEHHAPKIFKEDCLIDWKNKARDVVNLIRGLSPIPCAYSILDAAGKPLNIKIYKAVVSDKTNDGTCGKILIEGRRMYVSAADYYVELLEIKPEGKKQMKAADFLNGFRF